MSCNTEISSLPLLNSCPPGSAKFLIIAVPALITTDNPGGYGQITYSELVSCLNQSDEPLRLIVDEDGAPVSNATAWINTALIGLGGTSGRIQIIIDNGIQVNYGANKYFDYDPSTGTITLRDGNTWQAGSTVWVWLNQ